MHLSPRTSKGVGKSTGLIGNGEGCAILFLVKEFRFAPGVNHLRVGISAHLPGVYGRTTGLNQTHGSVPGTQYFLGRRMSDMALTMESPRLPVRAENHTGD